MSPRELNLLLRITGWADEKLQNCCEISCETGLCPGKTAALEELLDYINELKKEVK